MSSFQVGILGYGNLGKYLSNYLIDNDNLDSEFSLAFIQNRSLEKINQSNIPVEVARLGADIAQELEHFNNENGKVDIVVEASHPSVVQEFGESILAHSSLMITSLTALTDRNLFDRLLAVAKEAQNKIFIPTGAGWGFEDIRKMSDRNLLSSANIAMKFHHDALKLNAKLQGPLLKYVSSNNTEDYLLFKGTVDEIASLAPNNVNTMCGFALAAESLGFAGIGAELYARKLSHDHEVIIEVFGPNGYKVRSHRINPANPGAVTGSMTFQSFLSSMLACDFNSDVVLQFV